MKPSIFTLTAAVILASPVFAHTETWRDTHGITHTDTVVPDATAARLDRLARDIELKSPSQLTKDTIVSGTIIKELDLDESCRGNPDRNSDCVARQALIYLLGDMGWCFGKTWQAGAEMEWHRCALDSNRPTIEDLHAYDTAE